MLLAASSSGSPPRSCSAVELTRTEIGRVAKVLAARWASRQKGADELHVARSVLDRIAHKPASLRILRSTLAKIAAAVMLTVDELLRGDAPVIPPPPATSTSAPPTPSIEERRARRPLHTLADVWAHATRGQLVQIVERQVGGAGVEFGALRELGRRHRRALHVRLTHDLRQALARTRPSP